MPPQNAFVGLLPHELRGEESFHGRADVRSALAVGHWGYVNGGLPPSSRQAISS